MVDIVSLPSQIQFNNYIKAWVEGKLHVNFISSLLNSVVTVFFVLFIQMSTLKMDNRFFTLIIPYIAIRLQLSVFLFESFVKTIPIELEEAIFG